MTFRARSGRNDIATSRMMPRFTPRRPSTHACGQCFSASPASGRSWRRSTRPEALYLHIGEEGVRGARQVTGARFLDPLVVGADFGKFLQPRIDVVEHGAHGAFRHRAFAD